MPLSAGAGLRVRRHDVSVRRRAGGKECGRRKTWEEKIRDPALGEHTFRGRWSSVDGGELFSLRQVMTGF